MRAAVAGLIALAFVTAAGAEEAGISDLPPAIAAAVESAGEQAETLPEAVRLAIERAGEEALLAPAPGAPGEAALPPARPTDEAAAAAPAPAVTVAPAGVSPPTLASRPRARPAALAHLPSLSDLPGPAAPVQSGPPRPRAAPPAPARSEAAEPVTIAARNLMPRALPPQGGELCGDLRLSGQAIAAITTLQRGCGIAAPVRLTGIAGIRMSRPITVNCRMATRLADWLEYAAIPAAEAIGEELVAIGTSDSYACRPRNNLQGAQLSEHGRGNAVDISGFQFGSGREISVLGGWRSKADGAFLKDLHDRACGPFTTVLGPNADRHHRNHFHLDLAERGTTYCR